MYSYLFSWDFIVIDLYKVLHSSLMEEKLFNAVQSHFFATISPLVASALHTEPFSIFLSKYIVDQAQLSWMTKAYKDKFSDLAMNFQ